MENEVLGMYELQLVNNGCLAEYSEDYKCLLTLFYWIVRH